MIEEEVLYDLGVDLNSNYTFVNGDIALSTYTDNLVQGVTNRLNTDLDEMDLFYIDYGSILQTFFGWKATDETLRYMEAEIKNVLANEPRISSHTCTCSYKGNGQVLMELGLTPIGTDTVVNVNLVLSTTGVIELETDEILIGEEE